MFFQFFFFYFFFYFSVENLKPHIDTETNVKYAYIFIKYFENVVINIWYVILISYIPLLSLKYKLIYVLCTMFVHMYQSTHIFMYLNDHICMYMSCMMNKL